MNFEKIIAEVKEELKSEPLGSSSTYYPLICGGKTGWDYKILRPKSKNSVLYILCEATLYGLRGNSVVFRYKQGELTRCDKEKWGWGQSDNDNYHIWFRHKKIPCEVIHAKNEYAYQKSYK